MRKLFLILIIGLFIVPNLAAAWCYQNSNDDHGLDLHTEVCGGLPECDGQRYDQICAGRWYAEVSHRGDQFHIAYQIDSWDTFTVDKNGFSSPTASKQVVSDGKVYLPYDGEKIRKYILLGHDYDENDRAWGWVGKQGGYLGDYFNKNYYTVECFENSDCASTEYCDKYQKDWSEWQCRTKECEAGDTKCLEKEYYTCPGDGVDQFTWVNNGRVVGECNVECVNDSQCASKEGFTGDQYCLNETATGRDYRVSSCQKPRFDSVFVSANSNHFTCVSSVEQRLVDDCEDVCRSGSCVDRGFFEKVTDWIKGLFS